MSRIVRLVLMAVISLFLSSGAFAARRLTSQEVYHALHHFMFYENTTTDFKVIGVQEFPQFNTAVADFSVTNMTMMRPRNDPVTAYAFGAGVGSFQWSGYGKVYLRKYNNGTWLVSKIFTPAGSWSNPSIMIYP